MNEEFALMIWISSPVQLGRTCYIMWDLIDQKHFHWNTPSQVHYHKLKYLSVSMPEVSGVMP